MELPRRGLTDQNVYQVHNLKAATAFFSTVYTAYTVRWSIVELAPNLSFITSATVAKEWKFSTD